MLGKLWLPTPGQIFRETKRERDRDEERAAMSGAGWATLASDINLNCLSHSLLTHYSFAGQHTHAGWRGAWRK